MFRRYVTSYDLPLLGEDMDLCQKVFDDVRSELKIDRGSERGRLLASSIIQFYKQGIKTESQLQIMARTAAIT